MLLLRRTAAQSLLTEPRRSTKSIDTIRSPSTTARPTDASAERAAPPFESSVMYVPGRPFVELDSVRPHPLLPFETVTDTAPRADSSVAAAHVARRSADGDPRRTSG